MNQMGNLEKLGILVIVILVVVVGVVAITPKDQVDSALFAPTDGDAAVPLPLEPAADGARPLDPATAGAPGAATASGPQAWPLGATGSDVPAPPPSTAGGTSPTTSTANVPAAGGPAPLTPEPAAPTTGTYTVKKGDTGESISKQFTGRRTGWSEIAALNPGVDARKLRIGQVLNVPTAKTAAAPAPTALGPAPAAPGSWPVDPAGGAGTSVAPPTTTGAAPAPVAPAPIAAEPKVYVVQSGDTLSDIARRELGSASKWKQILDANSEVLHGSEVVRVGMKLRIPARSGGATASAPAAPASSPAASGGRTYTVQSGDTLSSIASRLLGSSARWREIQRANEGVLHGSDRLTVGMELSIPGDVAAR